MEHYGFEDKRGLKAWADWNESARQYTDLISRYTLPFERDHSPRIITGIPEIPRPTADGRNITVNWKTDESFDGFIIYRRSSAEYDLPWEEAAVTDGSARSWTDEGLEGDTLYTYTVVPYRTENGVTVYGSFKVKGISARTGE